MMAAWIVKGLIAEYLLVAVAYAWQRDWARCGYFVSAAGMSVSVLGMR